MGFLRKIFLHIISIALLYSCSQPIILKNMSAEDDGYFIFGKSNVRNNFENISITEYLQPLWVSETSGSQANNSVLIYGKYLFAADLSGRIYVFDRNEGKQLGYEKFPGAISANPVIYKLKLFFVVNEREEKYSTFIHFDFVNGKILSEDLITGSVSNELLLLDDGIVVVTDSGEIIKYNLVGTRLWSTKTKTTTQSSPVSDGKVIVFGNQLGEIVIVDCNDGTIKYKEKIADPIESGISMESDTIYFGDRTGKIYSFDIDKKKINWEYNTGSNIKSMPVFDANNVIVGNLAGKVFSIDKSSGEKNWMINTQGVINTTPLLTNSYLYQPDLNKKVHVINKSLGEIVKTYDFERRLKLMPIYYDGIIYLGSDKGEIHAFQTFKMN